MQDGWAETKYVKGASKKKVSKGCSENGGDAHYYVTEKVINVPPDKQIHEWLLRPYCLLCNHRAGKGVFRKRHTLPVVETRVYTDASARKGECYIVTTHHDLTT